MVYRIDISGIKSAFKFKPGGGLSFSTGTTNSKFPLLPYSTHATELDIDNSISNFASIVGIFSRLMNQQGMDMELDLSVLPEILAEKVTIGTNEDRVFFMHFIRDTFLLESGRILLFHPQILNYQSVSNKEHKKLALFLYNILYDDSVKKEISNLYSTKTNNILFKLMLESIPSNKDHAAIASPAYFNYVPYVKKVFLEDLQFLSGKFDLYLNNIDKFLKYYYFYYISQLTLKLDKIFEADLTKPETLFST